MLSTCVLLLRMANVEAWRDEHMISSPVSTPREVTPSSPTLSPVATPSPPESVRPENTPSDPVSSPPGNWCAPVTKEMADVEGVIFQVGTGISTVHHTHGCILSYSQDLHLATALDEVEVNQLALAHACEATDLLQAHAYIQERRYNQALITARSYKISMLKARRKVDNAVQVLKRFRTLAQAHHPRPANYGNDRSTVEFVAIPSHLLTVALGLDVSVAQTALAQEA
jgi:hypothetical protein